MGIGDLIDGIEAMLTMSGLGKIQTSINAANYAVPLVGAANNNPGKPKGYMELPDFSKVLGALGIGGKVVLGELAGNASIDFDNYSMSLIAIKGQSAGNALLYSMDAWNAVKLHGSSDSTLATLANKGNGQWTLTIGSIPVRYCILKLVPY